MPCRRPTLTICALLLLLPSLLLAQEVAVPVTVAKAQASPVISTLELTGSIIAKRQARLSSRTSGLIQKLHVDAGSSVKAGDVLMELDPTQAELVFERIQVEGEQAAAELAEAQRQLEEVRHLAKSGGFSKSEAETRETAVRVQTAAVKRIAVQLREQKEIIARHKLLAPFDGVIRLKQAEEGEWVQTGTPVVELIETGDLLLDVQVPQEFYARLDRDAEITARLDAHPATELKATVATRVAATDPVSRTFLARLKLDDPKGLAAPGMSARATFRFKDKETALQVPRDAIVRSQDGSATVWSVTPTPGEDDLGTVKAHTVKTGPALSKWVVILEGLAPDATVVLSGNESLRDGQTVRITH
jgi:RND family efflux transporter MFP subunit